MKGGSDVISRAGIQPGHGGLKRGEERGKGVCRHSLSGLCGLLLLSFESKPGIAGAFPSIPELPLSLVLNGKEAALT